MCPCPSDELIHRAWDSAFFLKPDVSIPVSWLSVLLLLSKSLYTHVIHRLSMILFPTAYIPMCSMGCVGKDSFTSLPVAEQKNVEVLSPLLFFKAKPISVT